MDADTVGEERRLAYVGITRARHQLTFTLEWEGRLVDQTPEKAEAKGKEALSRLKSLFD